MFRCVHYFYLSFSAFCLFSSTGKRGRRRQAHVVDISEIVNKIAPKVSDLQLRSNADRTFFLHWSSLLKHGRPETAESTLQQWFDDNATIPCTPDLQVSKPKRSPRWVLYSSASVSLQYGSGSSTKQAQSLRFIKAATEFLMVPFQVERRQRFTETGQTVWLHVSSGRRGGKRGEGAPIRPVVPGHRSPQYWFSCSG